MPQDLCACQHHLTAQTKHAIIRYMNAKQLSKLNDNHLTFALLYEAGLTLNEIAKREKARVETVRLSLKQAGIARRQRGRWFDAGKLSVPIWQRRLHERLREFGLTTGEASWLLSINIDHVSTTGVKVGNKSAKSSIARKEGTCTFRFALTAKVWLETEALIINTAIMDGARSADVRYLTKLSNGSARNYVWQRLAKNKSNN